jgi:hypothetical protein
LADRRPQNFANHRRLVPGYHFAVFGALVAYLVYALVQLFRAPSLATAISTLLALALLGMFFYVRIFALAVQDRIIRLEMRLRLKEILPPDLKARIGELDKDQLIGLRFAGDAEMADLMREVLTNGIHDRDEIKRRVKDWQADYWRC